MEHPRNTAAKLAVFLLLSSVYIIIFKPVHCFYIFLPFYFFLFFYPVYYAFVSFRFCHMLFSESYVLPAFGMYG